MDARREALLVGDPAEECRQPDPFLRVESGEEVVLVRAGRLPDPCEHPAALLGHVQLVMTAVLGAAAPFHEPLLLQVVDERDDPARYDAEVGGERALAAPRVHGDHPQQADIRRREAEFADPFAETLRRVCPELGEQERAEARGCGWGRSGIFGWLPVGTHTAMVRDKNDSL